MDSWHPSGPGFTDGPLTSDNFKRAVHRPPPSKFTVEMLGALKQGRNYSYGMRIIPVTQGDRSSISSRGLDVEYEVWRRWEDCLWFQENLGTEYRRMARSKRQRLLRGKGVRKDGFYKQDQASSWESLPPGPDPNSVARDIHQHIPALSKRGVVFRASNATIEQRAAEFKAMIEGLLKDDVPALIEELRNTPIVIDFFGFWRRDYDHCEKSSPRSTEKARASVTSSILSTYFSSSNLNLHDAQTRSEKSTSPRSPSTLRSAGTTYPDSIRPRYRKSSSDSSDVSPSRPARARASSTASSDFSSAHSDRSMDGPIDSTTPAIVVDDGPVVFDHNPYRRSDPYISERPSSALAVLPEDHEVCLKSDPTFTTPPLTRRRRKSSDGTRGDKTDGIYFSPTDSFVSPREPIQNRSRLTLADRNMRESWQTIDSASCILEGIGMTMPDYPHRTSISSIATFMTDCSANAIIPQLGESSNRRRRPRVSCPVSISEDDDNLWCDNDGDLDTVADSFPLPPIDVPHETRSETPLGYVFARDEQLTPSFPRVPPSPTKSTAFSVSTVSPDKLAIKAGYNNSIILLRVESEITYKEMRQRLYNKFVGQEGIPLSESFTITFIQPVQKTKATTTSTPDEAQACSSPVLAESDTTQLHLVTSQADWENVIASLEGYKLTLRITDNIPS